MAHIKEFEHLKIRLEAIKSATNNFAKESCIGGGGFGKVYRGEIAGFDGHTTVALKRLDPQSRSGQGGKEFWTEVMMLSLYKHKNVVSLLGFCDDCGEMILVYEYVPNKSLDHYLNSPNLRWTERLKICIGVARGLAYLHSKSETQHRLLHRDIKSSNILLDEDWDAKISDFGLSKFVPANPKYTFDFSNAVGTPGYCDPLYAQTGLLTKESDVYSFGVVLFEVLCGRISIDYKNRSHPPLTLLAQQSYEQNTINEIVYSEIKDEIHPESLKVFAAIAYQCLKGDRVERPLMSDILLELETALGYQVGLGGHIAWRGGVLVDTIHEGSDLERRNAFDFLRLGYDMRRTTSGYKNNNPVWKETFKFTLEKPAKAILKLAVLSDSSSWPRNNLKENLDDVDISVLDVVKEKHMNNVYNIGNGRIELQLEPSALPVKTKPKILQFIAGGNKAKNLAINVFGLQL